MYTDQNSLQVALNRQQQLQFREKSLQLELYCKVASQKDAFFMNQFFVLLHLQSWLNIKLSEKQLSSIISSHNSIKIIRILLFLTAWLTSDGFDLMQMSLVLPFRYLKYELLVQVRLMVFQDLSHKPSNDIRAILENYFFDSELVYWKSFP